LATDRVFLTGASGFVGSHVLRELLGAGYPVRALARRPDTDGRLATSQSAAPGEGQVEVVTGDLRRVGDFARSLDGCRYIVHCAALYSFAPRDRAMLEAVNVIGTQSLLAAAHIAGVERAVLTSSSATIGPACGDQPADETCHPERSGAGAQSKGRGRRAHGGYHGSKIAQERAAFASRVPVVVLLPTAPVGPGDWKPTPTGKLIRDFARGKIVAKAPGNGGMNLVAVEDVARAHVAALTNGRAGERYVIGGENLSMDAIWQMLAKVSGRAMPSWRAPYALALATAYVDEIRCRINPKADPFAPLEGVHMARDRMYADSAKARRELDHQPTDVRDALARAVTWYRENA
jgi:dihydroflavonol-4-reductase